MKTWYDLSPSLRQVIREHGAAKRRDKAGWKASLQAVVLRDVGNGLLSRAEAIEVLEVNHCYGPKGQEMIAALDTPR